MITPSCWRTKRYFREFSVEEAGKRFSRRSAEVERAFPGSGVEHGGLPGLSAATTNGAAHGVEVGGGDDGEGFKALEEVQPGRSRGGTISLGYR